MALNSKEPLSYFKDHERRTDFSKERTILTKVKILGFSLDYEVYFIVIVRNQTETLQNHARVVHNMTLQVKRVWMSWICWTRRVGCLSNVTPQGCVWCGRHCHLIVNRGSAGWEVKWTGWRMSVFKIQCLLKYYVTLLLIKSFLVLHHFFLCLIIIKSV